MERKRHANSPLIALLIALLDVVLIIFLVQGELPDLQAEFQIPFPQILTQAGIWFKLAEVMFQSAGLIMVYGMISLIFPRLRFILQLETGLVNLAGVPYLLSLVMTYRSHNMGVTIQQAIFMFLLCMLLPYLVSKLFGAINSI
ncbi:MAG: hypothetical protein WAV05_14825 [Anaerolineales bacterium]